MDRIFRHSQQGERFQFSDFRIPTLIFADDVVLLAPLVGDLQLSLEQLAAKCEGMRIRTSKSEIMVLSQKRVECFLWVGSKILPQVEEFKYLRVLFTSNGRMQQEINRQISAVSAVVQTLY